MGRVIANKLRKGVTEIDSKQSIYVGNLARYPKWHKNISTSVKCDFTNYKNFWADCFNPYPTAFPYGNGMVLHFYQQQESSTTKTVHKVINKGLKTYV